MGIIVTCIATVVWLRDPLGLFVRSAETQEIALSVENNGFVMQFLTDLLGVDVANTGIPDVSALGAAFLAGLHESIFIDIEQLEGLSKGRQMYSPEPQRENVQGWYAGWKQAVEQLL
jgi:glycerol kinase